MSALEFLATAVIATYAMIGGAVLNGAITSPYRCMHVLSFLHRWVRPFISSAVALWAVAIYRAIETDDFTTIVNDPIAWVAISEMILLEIFVLANRFAIEAGKTEYDQED